MNLFLNIDDVDTKKYVIATYEVTSSSSLRDAAWNIAIGQSVGNPNVRNEWETEELFEKHSCIIIGDESKLSMTKSGKVVVGFPTVNTNWRTDGISHLLCQLMGGHVDIDIIQRCRLVDLVIPEFIKDNCFFGPRYGITGIREFTGQYDKPILGGIVKPKIGVSPEVLLDMVKQMVDGGVDFIKEDEIMSNPACCPLLKRVDLISNYLANQSRKVIFCHTINCDPGTLTNRVNLVYKAGANGVHINVWSGLGSYNSIRQMDLPLFLHFQKSGDRVFTSKSNNYSISWPVICQLATMMGVDTIQTGMIGGYSNDDPEELSRCLKILRARKFLARNTLPVLSCGMHPGLVNKVTSMVGNDYMANVGGAIHGHPNGSRGGAVAMRSAIDGDYNNEEYKQAIQKWGLVN